MPGWAVVFRLGHEIFRSIFVGHEKFRSIFHKIFFQAIFFRGSNGHFSRKIRKQENRVEILHFLRSVFSKNIGFQRKSWIETHIKSRILVIMEQKSRLYMEPVLSNGDPLKKQWVTFFQFFLILTDFSSILIKNNMKYPKNPFFLMKIEYKTIFLRCLVQKIWTPCF